MAKAGPCPSRSATSSSPEKIIKQYGAEVLRLWVASVEYNEDVRFSDTILARLDRRLPQAPEYVPLRARHLADFDPATDAVPGGRLLEVDQWILLEADELVRKCRAWYDEYAFHKVYRAVYDFATVQPQLRLFRYLKDRLYTAAPDSHARRSAQTAIYRINYALVRLLAPLLAFTTEEVWSYMRKPKDEPAASMSRCSRKPAKLPPVSRMPPARVNRNGCS